MESKFLQTVAAPRGLALAMNPEKERNKYAVDFITPAGVLVDLKTIREPFFTAGRYGYDASYTITLNVKDCQHYAGRNVWILFWVDWKQQERFGVRVGGLSGLWTERIDRILAMCRVKHEYITRKGDSRNGTASYLLDVRNLLEVK